MFWKSFLIFIPFYYIGFTIRSNSAQRPPNRPKDADRCNVLQLRRSRASQLRFQRLEDGGSVEWTLTMTMVLYELSKDLFIQVN